jgi:hypothetical protein
MNAGGTILVSRFVKISGNNTVIQVAATSDRIVGISQQGARTAPVPAYTTDPPEAAVVGDQLQVFTNGMTCKLRAGTGGWSAGDEITSDTSGQGVRNPRTGHPPKVGAIALEDTAAGEYGDVQVTIYNGTPTAFT